MRAKFRRWLIFIFLLALLPILFNLLLIPVFAPPLTWASLLGEGELLLIAVGFSTAALGDAMSLDSAAGSPIEGYRDWVVGACAANLALASFFFAVVATANDAEKHVGYALVVSFGLYISAAITGAVCASLTGR